ncbi:calcium-binding protein [Marinicaulis aureus]|uniref:Calcium-binding protein n=1 Tax=Hyphococcus aureus TaxID=2666033 RepID=A0ABW1KZ66_9PROT
MWTFTTGAVASGVSAGAINQTLAVLDEVLQTWGRYFDFGGAVLDVKLSIIELDPDTLAQAGTTFTEIDTNLYHADTILETQTGIDQNGAEADIEIELNSLSYIANELFLGGSTQAVPVFQYDLYTILLHEVAHALGFLSFYGEAETSVFDSFLVPTGGNPIFTGQTDSGRNVSINVLADDPSHQSKTGTLLFPVIDTGKRFFLTGTLADAFDVLGLSLLEPTSGDDVLYAFPSGPTVSLLDGDDLYYGKGGPAVFGGDGNDTILGDANLEFYGEGALYYGEDGDDLLTGHNSLSNHLEGGPGADTLRGGDFFDFLTGDIGDDSLVGYGGDDYLNGYEDNDTLIGGAGADDLNGGTGNDWAKYNSSPSAVAIDLGSDPASGGDAEGDILTSIENIFGSKYNDTLIGDGGDNEIGGGLGNDEIRGDDGADTLKGAAGFDLIFGDNGDDYIDGGSENDDLRGSAGNDTVLGGYGRDVIRGNSGDDDIRGGAGGDTLAGGLDNDEIRGASGDDAMKGEAGDDYLSGGIDDDLAKGNEGADTLLGGDGNDSLYGNPGDDLLYGQAGNDDLRGGNDNDTLDGGAGNDTLRGNSGDDVFVYAPGADDDLIIGFEGGAGAGDVIDLSVYDGIFDDFADVQASASDDGFGNVVIDLGGGDSITLANILAADLDADDFLF